MNYPEYVNRYCFNPGCSVSIFNAPTFAGIKTPIVKVLEEEGSCAGCGEKYIAVPILEIKLMVYESFHSTAAETIA